MVQLIPMSEAEFEAFMKISMADHIQAQIISGKWRFDDADENMEKLRSQILPQGFVTPNHHFLNIQDDKNGQVGGLWYMVAEGNGKRLIFVVDIQVHVQFRRRGYGSQAFLLLEDLAHNMGINKIVLNVFEHNHQARAMYEKLGYSGKGETMTKEI